MKVPSELYNPSMALLTDLYQLTMGQAYWQSGLGDHEAVFHLFFRSIPFGGGFALACGLAQVIDFLEGFQFTEEDLAYLAGLKGGDGAPLFAQGFLEHLGELRLTCDVDAVPDGTVAFAHAPILRVRGPIIQAQLLESALLDMVNFETLIATKAARVCLAAQGDPVLEFGLRRAQGVDGSLTAARAAYIGGCVGTSNVLAGKLFDIPVKGTHAHSWVMAFDDELESFEAYARAQPNNCIFLVDTYDTLRGVRRAVEVGKRMRTQGHEMVGVRLDSGDLAYLSIEARRILDEAGFPDAVIVASNELDEHLIESLKHQGAAISVWGVGTKLVTAYDQPALGGVYKLAAIRAPGGRWRHRIKLSEQAVKVSAPGVLQVRRYSGEHGPVADLIWDELRPEPEKGATLVDPFDPTRRRRLEPGLSHRDLLQPVFSHGKRLAEPDTPHQARARAKRELATFHPGIKRFVNPHEFPVGLEEGLFDLKTRLVMSLRERTRHQN